MRRFASLRRNADFSRVRRRGRRSEGRHVALVAVLAPGDRPPQVGIVTSKAVGNAVVRNRARRRLRAALDGFGYGTARAFDLVVTVRPSGGQASFEELRRDLATALDRLP